MERRVYGSADFATSLRSACVLCGMRHHTESLRAVRRGLAALQRAALADQPPEQPEAGPPALPLAYHAHLAVLYHNLAAQLARVQLLQDASAAVKVAEVLVSQVLHAARP
jgi:hypothetical protein